MLKTPLLLLLKILILLGTFGSSFSFASDKYHITISQLVSHPALDNTYQGIVDSLNHLGFIKGENLQISYSSAHGDLATNIQISKQHSALKPNILVGISTQSSQALVANSRGLPVVFSAVSNPSNARLVPNSNVTGISALSPIEEQLDLITQHFPAIKTIGVVFNPAEDNSTFQVELLSRFSDKLNIELIKAPLLNTSGGLQATQYLIDKVDLIYLPTDNTVASALPSILSVANQAKIPTFGGAISYVDQGATFGSGFKFYDIGIEAGKVIGEILNGATPSDLPVRTPDSTCITVNQIAAREIDFPIPQSFLNSATTVTSNN